MALPRKSSYLMGGTFDSVPPTLNDGDFNPLELDVNGNLKVTVVSGGGSGSNAAAGPTGSAVPTSADYIGVNISGVLRGVTGFSLNAGNTIPAAVAIVDGSGNQITSFGGGSQFAMGSAQASNALGTIALGYDGTNVRGLLTSNTGQLHTIIDSATLGTVTISGNVNQAIGVSGFEKITDGTNTAAVKAASTAAVVADPALVVSMSPNSSLPAGTNVIGHVVVDSGTIAVTQSTNPWTVQGTAAALSAVSGNPVLIAGSDNAGNVQYLPVGAIGAGVAVRALVIGGSDLTTGHIQQALFGNGALVTALATTTPFLISTSNFVSLVSATSTTGALIVGPYVYSAANSAWGRLSDAGVVGTVGVGGAAASGTTKGGNPVQIGGVFNDANLPTVISGQVVEAQSTAHGSLIVGTGVDKFNVQVTSSPLDEYGNQVQVANDIEPWRQALLDEMRAVRLGLQVLCRYINPGSGIQYTTNTPVGVGRVDSEEPDLIAWAQSIRSGSEDVIQG